MSRLPLTRFPVLLVVGILAGLPTLPAQTIGDDEREGFSFTPETIQELVRTIVEKKGRRVSVLQTVHPDFSSPRDLAVARRIRATRLSLELRDSRVVPALGLVARNSGLNIVVSRRARQHLLKSPRTIDLKLERIPLEHVLSLVLIQLGEYRFTIRYGALRLVHLSEFRPVKFRRIYDVSDLVRKPRDFRAPKLGLTGL